MKNLIFSALILTSLPSCGVRKVNFNECGNAFHFSNCIDSYESQKLVEQKTTEKKSNKKPECQGSCECSAP